jgi:hypothetical protein
MAWSQGESSCRRRMSSRGSTGLLQFYRGPNRTISKTRPPDRYSSQSQVLLEKVEIDVTAGGGRRGRWGPKWCQGSSFLSTSAELWTSISVCSAFVSVWSFSREEKLGVNWLLALSGVGGTLGRMGRAVNGFGAWEGGKDTRNANI